VPVRSWLWLALWVGLAACGAEEGVLPLGRHCEALVVACHELTPCCADRGHAVDAVACADAVEADCEARIDQAASAGAIYDAQAGASCVDGFRAWLARCDPEAPPPAVCDEVFRGEGAPGALPGSVSGDGALDGVCAVVFE
jgi:hypothetical protein